MENFKDLVPIFSALLTPTLLVSFRQMYTAEITNPPELEVIAFKDALPLLILSNDRICLAVL